MRFFEDTKVTALISDASIDFTPSDFDSSLTQAQRGYLKSISGMDIAHVFWRNQVHGDHILVATDSSVSSKGMPDADALITSQQGLPIAIRTADCVPVFLFDPVRKAAGLAHAGWKGTRREIAYKTILRMKDEFGCNPQDILAVLGPSIQKCCYQVGEEFRQYFPDDLIDRGGNLYVNVAGNNHRQLIKAGLKEEHIHNTGICTCCDQSYFSYRRNGYMAGRMISLMVLR